MKYFSLVAMSAALIGSAASADVDYGSIDHLTAGKPATLEDYARDDTVKNCKKMLSNDSIGACTFFNNCWFKDVRQKSAAKCPNTCDTLRAYYDGFCEEDKIKLTKNAKFYSVVDGKLCYNKKDVSKCIEVDNAGPPPFRAGPAAVPVRDCSDLYTIDKVYEVAATPQKASLAFILDFSGSMGGVISNIKTELSSVIASGVIGDVYADGVTVGYSDPSAELAGPPATTGAEFDKQVGYLSACKFDTPDKEYYECGGNCPEAAFAGLAKALTVTREGSKVYLFTDATGLDESLIPSIISTAQAWSTQIYFILNKYPCGDSSYTKYAEIASATGGAVYKVETHEIGAIVGSQNHSARMETLIRTEAAVNSINISEDTPNSITDFTLEIIGSGGSVACYNDEGWYLSGETLMDTSGGKIVSFARNGWTFWDSISCDVSATGSFSVNVFSGFRGCDTDPCGPGNTCTHHEDCRLFTCDCEFGYGDFCKSYD